MSAASDVSFYLDPDGVIAEVAVGEMFDASPAYESLVGKVWLDTVTNESRKKGEQLLFEVRGGRRPKSREINQLIDGLGEIPLRFTAVAFDSSFERVVVLGRDLRAVSRLQQGLVQAQQAMDREYDRLRQADTRYRVFFHVAGEGVIVVDALTRKIIEANPASSRLLGEAPSALQGRALVEAFAPSARNAIEALLAGAAGGAPVSDVRIALRDAESSEVTASATVFRQAGSAVVLFRFWSGAADGNVRQTRTSRVLSVMEALPDGFVCTDESSRIIAANVAFCELVNRANENQVLGEPLDRWLGRPSVDLNIMLANVREHGAVRNFATIVRGDFGESQEALVTAVAALDGKTPCYGFTVRAVTSRVTPLATSSAIVPRSVEQLRELVGRVSLKELVRESADLIERLCIEAALDVSGNNRASAAQLLGLSRQGLYSKLRRHNLEEFDPT